MRGRGLGLWSRPVRGEKLPVDGSLQESKVLDSLGLLDIITFMEQRFGIEIAGTEILEG